MVTFCIYCEEPEDKQEKPGLICDVCSSFVHLCCLQRPGTPGDFSCDVFFNFTCLNCSKTKQEIFERKKFPWVNVLLLTLHHLTKHSYGISNRGYFHYKTHICSFIGRNWGVLFDKSFKQKKNWIGTIAGVLSIYNGLLVCSGSLQLKEGGWWMLMHYFSPAVASHIVQELAKDKPKWRSRNLSQLEPNLFLDKVTEMGYYNLLNLNRNVNDENYPEDEEVAGMPAKRLKVASSDDGSATSSHYDNYNYYNMNIEEVPEENAIEMPSLQYSDLDYINAEYNHHVESSETSSKNSYQYNFMSYETDGSNSNLAQEEDTQDQDNQYQDNQDQDNQDQDNQDTQYQDTQYQEDTQDLDNEYQKKHIRKRNILAKKSIMEIKRDNLFSIAPNSDDMPWEEDEPEPQNDLLLLSKYEETQLYNKISDLLPRVSDPNKKCELRRLYAKLNVRKIQRHKHLPLFDIDNCARECNTSCRKDTNDYTADRVLDRFQRSYLLDKMSGAIAGNTHVNIILRDAPLYRIRSHYSKLMFNPIIRRDREMKPLWVRFQEELIQKASGGERQYEADYVEFSYIRPHDVAAINALCELYFWPGIDVSESLLYPEYSCVATYRRMVVGVALVVPPAGADNCPEGSDAYLSFLCTRAHWQKSGIASYMLYHLINSCPSSDFTLHVSPVNPAILLYQKFCFKTEKFILGFYEKYIDRQYRGCTHAVFMRRQR